MIFEFYKQIYVNYSFCQKLNIFKSFVQEKNKDKNTYIDILLIRENIMCHIIIIKKVHVLWIE